MMQTRCISWTVCGSIRAISLRSRSSAVIRRSKRSAASGPNEASVRSSEADTPTSLAMRSTSASAKHCSSDLGPFLAQSSAPLQQGGERRPAVMSTGQGCHLTLLSSIVRIATIGCRGFDLGQHARIRGIARPCARYGRKYASRAMSLTRAFKKNPNRLASRFGNGTASGAGCRRACYPWPEPPQA